MDDAQLAEIENLGVCEACRKDVVYDPARSPDDPCGPTYVFDLDDHEDVVYHWGCLHPVGSR
jgi:hypothetical protein